jgi:hypothetical protein
LIREPRPDPLSPPALVDPYLSRIDAGLSRPPRGVETTDPHQTVLIQSDPLFALTIRGCAGVLRAVPFQNQGQTVSFLLVVDVNDPRIVTRGPGSKRERFRAAGRVSLRVPNRSILFHAITPDIGSAGLVGGSLISGSLPCP